MTCAKEAAATGLSHVGYFELGDDRLASAALNINFSGPSFEARTGDHERIRTRRNSKHRLPSAVCLQNGSVPERRRIDLDARAWNNHSCWIRDLNRQVSLRSRLRGKLD